MKTYEIYGTPGNYSTVQAENMTTADGFVYLWLGGEIIAAFSLRSIFLMKKI